MRERRMYAQRLENAPCSRRESAWEAFQGGEKHRQRIACKIPAETVCAGVCGEAAGFEKKDNGSTGGQGI